MIFCVVFAWNNSVSQLAVLTLYSHSPIKDPGFPSTVAMVTAPWIQLHSYRSADMNSPPHTHAVLTSLSCITLIRAPTRAVIRVPFASRAKLNPQTPTAHLKITTSVPPRAHEREHNRHWILHEFYEYYQSNSLIRLNIKTVVHGLNI